MNTSRFSPADWLGRLRRPIATPTMLSLLVAIGTIGAAMLLADRTDNQAVAATGPTRPNLNPGSSHAGISFRDRLIAGLQARRGSEVDFIDAVVHKVRIGKLPERLVNQTFFWSRDRAARPNRTTTAGTQRPIIYFQPVMSAQAKRLGVAL